MAKQKKLSIPVELKNIWSLDYYKLTNEQRKSLTDFYIKHLQAYESAGGSEGPIKKLDPPYFMTQNEIIEKEEMVKMNVDAMIKQQEDDLKEAQRVEKEKLDWEQKRIIQMEQVERLMLENLQLKLEMTEKALRDINEKKKDLTNAQVALATKMENKYGIILDDYAIDLLTGVMVRYPHAVQKK